MSVVAVVAHRGKRLRGGLDGLRAALASEGVHDPIWFEVDRAKAAAKAARSALEGGAELLFVWGGDGTVQRCLDALAGSDVPVAILPAGTANLLATNLGVPRDLEEAVRIGLHGARRPLDLGVLNGEHFAVMAGAGFDAYMLDGASRSAKARFGRLTYVWSGARNLGRPPVRARISVDGEPWLDVEMTCLLIGNVSRTMGGVRVFPAARPDDGVLDVGVVTARGPWQWATALVCTLVGRAGRSRHAHLVRAHTLDVRLESKLPFELDGGTRGRSRHLEVSIEPGSVTLCVPTARAEEE